MKKIIGLVFALSAGIAISGCQSQSTSTKKVLSPSEMTAEIIVDGRLSKLVDMDIQYVGKSIPYTYSHKKIANSPGYYWWVSKHFAIKSDLPEHKVKLYLELLELSYPHYVSLFGAEPANIDNQRIAVVYGSSRDSTKESMFDDGFTRGVHKHAGGETMYYNRAGYSFPSHREQHQRYIVIHETMHAYHMALTGHSTWAPNWITEGLADSIASHVYYPDTNELAVMVFDRAPMNYILTGLRQYQKGGQPSIEQINNDPALKRGLNFFIVHFLLSDPERAYYFSLFRDRLMSANPHSDATLPTANKLLKETFPNWSQLEAEFANFVKQINASFFIAQGPWEQNGDKYWIRGHKNNYVPRLDIRNNQTINSDVPVQDFPQPEKSPLVKSDNANFEAGVLIDFVPEQLTRGSVGLGLGLTYHQDNKDYFATYENKYKADKDSYLSITLHQGRKVSVAGVNLDFKYQAYALTPELLKAVKTSNQLGLSVSLHEQNLTLHLASGKYSQVINVLLTDSLKSQLQDGHLSLLAANARHKLTPYFKTQPNEQDYFAQVDVKQWTSNGQLYRIFQTCIEFELPCSDKLSSLIGSLKRQDESVIAAEVDALLTETLPLVQHNNQAMLTLSGAKLTLLNNKDDLKLEVNLPTDNQMIIDNTFVWYADNQKVEQFNHLKTYQAGKDQLHIRANEKAEVLQLSSVIQWQGQTFEYEKQVNKQSFDGVYLTPHWRQDKDTVTVTAELTGPYSGKTSGTISFELLPNLNSDVSNKQQNIEIAPYETKSWQQSFDLSQVQATNVAIEVKAKLVVDGEDIYLSELIYLN